MRWAAGEKQSILSFDLETLAAGFADPDWVPQKIMCVAWSWVGSDEVHCRVCGPMGFFKPKLRARMLAPFLADYARADMLTGHNIARFDLPILNAECLRLGFPPLRGKRVQDTIRIVKTKGFKKGQDNLAGLLETLERKLAMDWQQWEDAYEEAGWPMIKERCASDVRTQKQVRVSMLERGWLRSPSWWSA